MLYFLLAHTASVASTTFVIDAPLTDPQFVSGPDTLRLIDGGSIIQSGDPLLRGIVGQNATSVLIEGGLIEIDSEAGAAVDLSDASSVTLSGGVVRVSDDRMDGIIVRDSIGTSSVLISGGLLESNGRLSTAANLRGSASFSMNGGIVRATSDDVAIGVAAELNSGFTSLSIEAGQIEATGLRANALTLDALGTSIIEARVIGGEIRANGGTGPLGPGIPVAIDTSVIGSSANGVVRLSITGGQVSSPDGIALFGRGSGDPQFGVHVRVEGGEIEGRDAIVARGTSRYTITGGELRASRDTILADQNGQVDILGGVITSSGDHELRATGAGTINLHARGELFLDGVALATPYAQPVPLPALTGALTGTLLDGTPFAYDYSRESNAQINVIAVPEPACLSIACLTSWCFLARSKT